MRDGNSTIPDGPADVSQADQGAGIVGEPGAVQVIVGTDATRIVLSGEVDAHHVTFMDSSGVAFLARLSIRSQHRVRLLRVPPTVRFLLEVTRIGELLDVVEGDESEFQPVGDSTS